MSWSVSLIGQPDKLVEALEAESARLTGQCKEEFDAAKPHIAGLVNQNYQRAEGVAAPVLQLEAHGSGYKSNGVEQYRSAAVTLKPLIGRLV
jgi:hypothetical protein